MPFDMSHSKPLISRHLVEDDLRAARIDSKHWHLFGANVHWNRALSWTRSPPCSHWRQAIAHADVRRGPKRPAGCGGTRADAGTLFQPCAAARLLSTPDTRLRA